MKLDPDVLLRHRIWTISNMMSFVRILLALPIALFLIHGTFQSRMWAVLFMLTASLTDFLDGYIARRRSEVTELGKIIDPIADKITVSIIALILATEGYVPVWFFAAVLLRDIFILVGAAYLKQRRNLVLQSNWIGKWTVTAIAVAVLSATLRVGLITDILIGISCVMLVWSLASYGRRFSKALQAQA